MDAIPTGEGLDDGLEKLGQPTSAAPHFPILPFPSPTPLVLGVPTCSFVVLAVVVLPYGDFSLTLELWKEYVAWSFITLYISAFET